MKSKSRTLALAIVFTGAVIGCTFAPGQAQGRGAGGQGQPNISPEEQTLARNIMSAADPAAKLKAAAELIKKYPKTSVRPRVARTIASEIASVKEAPQKLILAQEYQKTFNQPSEAELIIPILIQAYADANNPDEAFAKGSEFLSRTPDDLGILVQLLSIGTEQAKKRNPKFIDQSIQYGGHAIELIEANKKPASMDDAGWKQYQTVMLPDLYRSMGLLYMAKGERAQAKAQYTKSSQLAPSDAFSFLMLAGLVNEEYQAEAKHFQSMPEGPAKTDELKKAQASLDAVIDAYAHAVAVSEGNAALGQFRQQYLQDLETYYKFRHKGSTEGMQQLIDKYKPSTKP